MSILWIVIGLVIIAAIVGIAIIVWGVKKGFKLLLNSLIGFFALWLTQQVLIPSLVINIWSVLLTAILGIIGYVAVIILHFIGVF